MYERLYGVRFFDGLFRAFDHLDAVIVRWMCGHRFRAAIYVARNPDKSRHLH
jgi:hypothetical protein